MSRSNFARKSQCCPKRPTPPPPPEEGTLTICKSVAEELLVGQNFEFTVTPPGTSTVISGVLNPQANCGPLFGPYPAGTQVSIQETLPGPAGSLPVSIAVVPPSAEIGPTVPGSGLVVVEIQAGQNVQVTYLNSSQG